MIDHDKNVSIYFFLFFQFILVPVRISSTFIPRMINEDKIVADKHTLTYACHNFLNPFRLSHLKDSNGNREGTLLNT